METPPHINRFNDHSSAMMFEFNLQSIIYNVVDCSLIHTSGKKSFKTS